MDDQLKAAFERLNLELKTGKRILIVIGAGASGEVVPSMPEIFEFIRTFLKGMKDSKEISDKEFKGIEDININGFSNLPRSLVYGIYSELQQNFVPTRPQFWKTIGVALLSGQIKHEQSKKDWTTNYVLPIANPTDCHKNLASLLLRMGHRVLIVSLNFDGLTIRAIREKQNSTQNQMTNTRVLSDKQSIEQYFGSIKRSRSQTIPIIKLRGDIFHATCTTENCRNFNVTVPIYDLPIAKDKIRDFMTAKEQIDYCLKCKECNEDMRLNITFPGIREKDSDNSELLRELVLKFGPNLGAIVTIGTSGKWDDALMHFLNAMEAKFRTKIYVVDKNDGSYLLNQLGSRCEFLQLDKNIFTDHLNAKLETVEAQEKSVIGPFKGYAPDGIWLQISEQGNKESFRVPKCFNPDLDFSADSQGGASIKSQSDNSDLFKQSDETKSDVQFYEIGTNRIVHAIFDKFKTLKNILQLGEISQLGIKNEVLHLKVQTREFHTRLRHSLGASFIAKVWMDALFYNSPKNTLQYDFKSESRHTVAAALLHDIGHLPFGHLTEEIMRELNWSLTPGIFSHEDINFELFEENDNKTLEEVLKTDLEYDTSVLLKLIKGKSGLTFGDTILNSGIDCDKIDYVFRDTILTGTSMRLDSPKTWLSEFLENQSTTKEGMIRLNGYAAIQTIELLKARAYLYEHFYFMPEVRLLESVCRLILIAWLTQHIPFWLKDEFEPNENKSFVEDLRRRKCIESIKAILKILNATSPNQSDNQYDTNSGFLFKRKDDFKTNTAEGRIMESIIYSMKELGLSFADEQFLDWIGQLGTQLDALFEGLKQEGNSRVDEIYGLKRTSFVNYANKFDILGHWYADKKDSSRIREICRELKVAYPCTVIFDIADMPDFWSTPNSRTLLVNGKETCCTNFLLPNTSPSSWNKHSIGKVSPETIRFSDLHKAKTQVLLFRPENSDSGKCGWVRDMYKDLCDRSSIRMTEVT